MDKKFKVISSSNEEKYKETLRIAVMGDLWQKQYISAVNKTVESNKNTDKVAEYLQSDLMRIALAGVKTIIAQEEIRHENYRLGTDYVETLEESKLKFQMIDSIFSICGCLTLKNFVTVFPVTKQYDGKKYGWKDYFYTMDVLAGMDWNRPIGRNNIPDLLWDYQNDDLFELYAIFTRCMSVISKAQTGKSIMEKWCEDNNVTTYTVNQKTGMIKDDKTGKMGKMSTKPSYLQVVK